jgi:hypothetical protein
MLDGLDSIASVYTDDKVLTVAGKKAPVRVELDVATRAAIASSAAMLFPQMRQLVMAVDYAQSACAFLCPTLQKSTSVPQ